jgi:bacterioferritin (cytochrome b1)
MIEDDLASEHIKLADRLGDDVTEQMLIGILKDEEEHANQWETVLGQ